MKTFTNSKFSKENENFGGEFSILNSHQYSSQKEASADRSIAYTSFLYILSILSITCWIVSLKMLPFGDMFQFLLGAVVLTVNLMVFKWTKL